MNWQYLIAIIIAPFLAIPLIAAARWLAHRIEPYLPRWLQRILFIRWGT